MKSFIGNIEQLTKTNNFFRHVLYTGKYAQLVVMSLKPGEQIGKEIHPSVDQFFRIDQGQAKVMIDGEEFQVSDGFAIIVPAGSEHNIINNGDVDLKLYTIYSPPNHPDGTINKTHQDAINYETEHH